MIVPLVEFISTIFSEKILTAGFYDVLEQRKIELKCTKIRLLQDWKMTDHVN